MGKNLGIYQCPAGDYMPAAYCKLHGLWKSSIKN
ncbi:class II SORL domain-containing protein [Sporomusa termitida]|nr:class II SORL domain-containing protein [Sporomusa termitida]